MLEYFTYKKVKKHKAAKKAREEEDQARTEAESSRATEASERENGSRRYRHEKRSSSPRSKPGTPVLDKEDEKFLEDILAKDGPAPPLPSRVGTPELDWSSDEVASQRGAKRADSTRAKDRDVKGKGKEKEKETKKPNRISMLFSKKKADDDATNEDSASISDAEKKREKIDLNNVLNRLNLTAANNKVLSLSSESSDLLQSFTQIFKDLTNGVPTAVDDLTKLIQDRDGAITRGFDKLPSGLQKLVTQLPEKITSTLAPEILAAAAKSQGIHATAEGGMKATAKQMFVPQNLFELATKPGAVVGMLRAIVTALKTRWPAFIGMNVIWSVALFLLMFVLWYCHKRGKEVRLEQEKAGDPIDGRDRIEELPHDPLLEDAYPEASRRTGTVDSRRPDGARRTDTAGSRRPDGSRRTDMGGSRRSDAGRSRRTHSSSADAGSSSRSRRH